MASWFQRLAKFSLVSNQSASNDSQRLYEQHNPAFSAGAAMQAESSSSRLGSGVDEDRYWHRPAEAFFHKDVLPSTYLEIHNECYEAYNANPLAYAIIELTTSFVLGEGLTIAARNQQVQHIINEFWRHPENRMDERVYSLCNELSLYGEQFIHFFVNRYDGSVIIRQIDPSLIDQIVTDPEDIEKPLWYHRRALLQNNDLQAGGVAGVHPPLPKQSSLSSGLFSSVAYSNEGHEPDLEGRWLRAGTDVVHVTINKVSNARRGKSDLAMLLPWLRRYKDWLLDRVRINKYKSAFFWDVTLNGADRKTIDRKRMEYASSPAPGSVIIHNEAETWSAVDPKINANDVNEDGRAVRLMIAVGASLPEHYLSDGENGNRATASEMSLPTLLKFKRRQHVVRHLLRMILDRVLQEAQFSGRLAQQADLGYEIRFPEIDSREQNMLAQGVQWLVPALETAKREGWISDETAMKMMFEYCGKEIDVREEQARVAAQQKRQKGGA